MASWRPIFATARLPGLRGDGGYERLRRASYQAKYVERIRPSPLLKVGTQSRSSLLLFRRCGQQRVIVLILGGVSPGGAWPVTRRAWRARTGIDGRARKAPPAMRACCRDGRALSNLSRRKVPTTAETVATTDSKGSGITVCPLCDHGRRAGPNRTACLESSLKLPLVSLVSTTQDSPQVRRCRARTTFA